MAAFDIKDTSFAAEISKIESIQGIVGPNLATLESTINGMSSYWEDEKSSEFISKTSEWLQDSSKKYNLLLDDVARVMRIIKPLFDIYKN